MKIIKSLEDIGMLSGPKAIALGNFDGVHIAHQKLLAECVNECRERSWLPCVCTFEPHPSMVISPNKKTKFISTPEQKYRLIESIGIKNVILLNFNEKLAQTSPKDFVREYLVELFQVRKIYIGYNYTFGKKGIGTPQLLKKYGDEFGFEVSVIEPVIIENEVVSSTLIREKYFLGDMPQAAKLLGYWPCLEGEVIDGDKRGREIGFPTANIKVSEYSLLPAYGVYAALIQTNKIKAEYPGIPAVVNIGERPTFNTKKTTVEVHVLNIVSNLYREKLKVNLIKQIRTERCFQNLACLKEQIKKDIKDAQTILNKF